MSEIAIFNLGHKIDTCFGHTVKLFAIYEYLSPLKKNTLGKFGELAEQCNRLTRIDEQTHAVPPH